MVRGKRPIYHVQLYPPRFSRMAGSGEDEGVGTRRQELVETSLASQLAPLHRPPSRRRNYRRGFKINTMTPTIKVIADFKILPIPFTESHIRYMIEKELLYTKRVETGGRNW